MTRTKIGDLGYYEVNLCEGEQKLITVGNEDDGILVDLTEAEQLVELLQEAIKKGKASA